MKTSIPFSGFYESLHDSEMDDTLNRMFSDRASGCHSNDGLVNRAFEACDWQAVQVEYAQAYAENFAAQFGLKTLRFSELQSPREYNFTTDRIFCTIGRAELRRLRREVSRDTLAQVAAEYFTSRSGFYSYYSPDVSTWGKVDKWDLNQCGALLTALARDKSSDGTFDHWAEHSLMESDRGNGCLDNMLDSNIKDIGRLYAVHEYLQMREARESLPAELDSADYQTRKNAALHAADLA